MSTSVDGSAPSTSPEPDGRPDVEPSTADTGPQWVQAEIQRRIAANRSHRSRHARDTAAGPAGSAPGEASPGAKESPTEPAQHAPRHSAPTSTVAAPPADAAPSLSPAGLPQRRRRHGRGTPAPPARPATAPADVAPADLEPAQPSAPTPPAAPVEPPASDGPPASVEPAAPVEPPAPVEPAPREPAAPVRPAAASTVAATPSPTETTDEIVDPPTAPRPVVLAARRVVDGPPARRLDQRRLTAPRPATPRSMPVVGLVPEPGSTRVRVVLSERKGVARPVRTIKEVQENTAVGDLLRRNLIRSQLSVTLRFTALTATVLLALPMVFALLPELGRFEVLGLRLPWLILGVLVYPLLVGIGWRYTHLADRVEQNFADHVQD